MTWDIYRANQIQLEDRDTAKKGLVRPREAFDQMHFRTTQESGEELSQILKNHRMRDRDLHLAAHSNVIVCDATFKTSPNNAC
ncbi:hypothetical protein L596_030556 [Steinernema carpocapsae]|uniref:Uncharacterized protein n=1 Tax=Steinernema carpocapsae TaxID=34508 RepID=A0A4U5LPR0_STECR|nr:hypothetical protein L596_030556 [Steinernema carpocapsae]